MFAVDTLVDFDFCSESNFLCVRIKDIKLSTFSLCSDCQQDRKEQRAFPCS